MRDLPSVRPRTKADDNKDAALHQQVRDERARTVPTKSGAELLPGQQGDGQEKQRGLGHQYAASRAQPDRC